MLSMTRMAGVTGLEPAASGVTGRRSNQLSYTPISRQPRPNATRLKTRLSGKTRLADCQACPPLLSKEKLNDPIRSRLMGIRSVKPPGHVTARGLTTGIKRQEMVDGEGFGPPTFSV